jgi:Tfp pilus assembly protein PilP
MPNLKRKKGRDSLFILFLFPLIAFTAATASQEVIYKEPRPPKKIFQKGSVDDKDKAAQLKGYLYDPKGKTDPFYSFIAIREDLEAKKKAEPPRTYLETLELSQLDLQVIVIGPKGKWAMVQDSKGLGHVIKEGTPIGINRGTVHEIKAGEVVIREAYKDFRGRTQIKDIVKKTPGG